MDYPLVNKFQVIKINIIKPVEPSISNMFCPFVSFYIHFIKYLYICQAFLYIFLGKKHMWTKCPNKCPDICIFYAKTYVFREKHI